MYHKSEFYNKGMLSAHPETSMIKTGERGQGPGRRQQGQGRLLACLGLVHVGLRCQGPSSV